MEALTAPLSLRSRSTTCASAVARDRRGELRLLEKRGGKRDVAA